MTGPVCLWFGANNPELLPHNTHLFSMRPLLLINDSTFVLRDPNLKITSLIYNIKCNNYIMFCMLRWLNLIQ